MSERNERAADWLDDTEGDDLDDERAQVWRDEHLARLAPHQERPAPSTPQRGGQSRDH